MSDTLFQEAVSYFEQGNLIESETRFRQLASDSPQTAEYHYYLGAIAFKKDAFDEALEYANRAVEITGDDYRFHELLGQIYGMKSQSAGVVKGMMLLPKIKSSFLKAVSLKSDSLPAREGLYMFYLFAPGVSGGDEKKALELLEEIKGANSARGHLLAAVYHMKKNDRSQAEAEFVQAGKEGKGDADIQMRIGQFYLNNDMPEKAAGYVENYLSLKPYDPMGWVHKGQSLFKTGQHQEALAAFQKALGINSQFAPAFLNRGHVLAHLGQTEEARRDFEFVIARNPKGVLAARAREAMGKL